MRKIMIGILIVLAAVFLMGQACQIGLTQECDPLCGEGYVCDEGVCVTEEEESTASATAFEITDVTNMVASDPDSITSSLHAYVTDSYSMGYLNIDNSFTDSDESNPDSAKALMLGVLSGESVGEQTITVSTDSGDIYAYIPAMTAPAEGGILVYVADDGSTYWADAEHDGESDPNVPYLSPEEALVEEHLARSAPY